MIIFLIIIFTVNIKVVNKVIALLNKEMKIVKRGKSWIKINKKNTNHNAQKDLQVYETWKLT